MADILAILEQQDGALRKVSREVLTAARSLADSTGGEVHAFVAGSGEIDCAEAGKYGADRVYLLKADELDLYQPDLWTAQVVTTVRDGGLGAVIVAASSLGRDLGPRVAARLDCPLATDVTSITADGGVEVTRPVYAGKAIYRIRIDASPCVISIRPNVFTAREIERAGTPVNLDLPDAVVRARTTALKAPERARLDVQEAPIVVSGGRGLKEPENFKLIEDLAEALGDAAIGASRAVVDAGWRPHGEQVGQTGKTVSPSLYFAIGISGAIQHLAGMRTARVIVAINKDKDAPIFKVADYGIVGDLFEVVPRLTEEIRKLRAN